MTSGMTKSNSWYDPSVLTLIMSYRCNAECSHCFFECSPRARLSMSGDAMERIIRESTGFKKISFSGGEPFLMQEELRKALVVARECGWYRDLAVVTNAFWASSMDSSLKALAPLRDAGLNFLALSADSYHMEYTPMAYFTNAARAAIELGLPFRFNVISPQRDFEKRPLPDIIEEISRGLGEEFIEQESLLRQIRLYSGASSGSMILQGRTNPVGRALRDPENNILIDDEAPEWDDMCVLHRRGRAASLEGQVLIMLPDYNCFPCCSLYSKEGHLSIGSAARTSMPSIIAAAEEDPLIMTIAKIGIKATRKIIDKYIGLYRESRFSTPCEFCFIMSQNRDIREIFAL